MTHNNNNNNNNNNVAQGAVLLVFSAIIVKLIGAVFKIPLSSKACLGDLGFGYFCIAYDLLTPFYSLAMAGLPIAVSKMVAEDVAKKEYSDVKQIFKVSNRVYALLGLAALVGIALFIYPFSRLTNMSGRGIYALLAILPATFFCCAMSSYRGFYEGFCNMYPTAVSELIEAFCKLGLGLGLGFAFIKLTGNPAIGAAGAVLGITIGMALSYIYLRLYHRFKKDNISILKLSDEKLKQNNAYLSKTLIIIAVPVALASLAGNISIIADSITVKWRLDTFMASGFSEIRSMYSSLNVPDNEVATFLYGIRGKAYTIFNLIVAFSTVIGVSVVPLIAGLNVSKSKEEIINSLNNVLRLLSMFVIPAGIGMMAAGDRIMALLYDSKASYEIGGDLLKIYGLAAIFAGFAIPLTEILQALGRQKAALFNISISFALKLALNIITVSVPSINIEGAAIATFVCYFAIFIMHFAVLLKSVKFIPEIRAVFLKPLLSGLICGITVALILRINSSDLFTVFAIFIAVLCYFVALILLNFFCEGDFLILPKGDRIAEFCKKHRIIR